MPTKFIKFKDPNQGATLMYLHPLIAIIMFDMSLWCHTRGIDFVVTDTISSLKRDKRMGRKHSGHRDKRSIDVRSRTFSGVEQTAFTDYFNKKYESIAQISSSDLVSRLVVLHGEGDNEHFHIGLHSRFTVNY